MALVQNAVCPTCARKYGAVVSSFEYGRKGALIRPCDECVLRSAKDAENAALDAARDAAWLRARQGSSYPYPYASQVADANFNKAYLQTLFVFVTAGDTEAQTALNRERFWKCVREEIEKT